MNGLLFDPQVAQAISQYIKCPFQRHALAQTCRAGRKYYFDTDFQVVWRQLSGLETTPMGLSDWVDNWKETKMPILCHYLLTLTHTQGPTPSPYGGAIQPTWSYAVSKYDTNCATQFIMHAERIRSLESWRGNHQWNVLQHVCVCFECDLKDHDPGHYNNEALGAGMWNLSIDYTDVSVTLAKTTGPNKWQKM